MPEDENGYSSRRPPETSRRTGDPYPPLTRWPEDASARPSDDDFLRERRVDRHRRSSSRESSGRERKHPRHGRERRSRVAAVVVLVLVAAAIAVTGVAAKQPVFGGAGSDSAPFSLVPITGGFSTSTTGLSTTSTSTAGTSTTSTTTTSTAAVSSMSTMAPEVDGGPVGRLVYALR